MYFLSCSTLLNTLHSTCFLCEIFCHGYCCSSSAFQWMNRNKLFRMWYNWEGRWSLFIQICRMDWTFLISFNSLERIFFKLKLSTACIKYVLIVHAAKHIEWDWQFPWTLFFSFIQTESIIYDYIWLISDEFWHWESFLFGQTNHAETR